VKVQLLRITYYLAWWRVDHNLRRPHSSLGHLTPNEFVAQRQAVPTVEVVAFSR